MEPNANTACPVRTEALAATDSAHLQEARSEASAIRAMAREGIDYQLKIKEELEARRDQQQAAAMAAIEAAELKKRDEMTVGDLFQAWIKDGVRRKDDNAELIRSFEADIPETLCCHQLKRATGT